MISKELVSDISEKIENTLNLFNFGDPWEFSFMDSIIYISNKSIDKFPYNIIHNSLMEFENDYLLHFSISVNSDNEIEIKEV